MSKQVKGQPAIDVSVANAIVADQGDGTVSLSSGVVLRASGANPNVLIRVMTAYERPEPPTYHSKEMGRMMENPEDPDYIARVKDWEMQYNSRVLSALIGLGTELVSTPRGMPGPKDDSWIEEYKAIGLPVIPNNPMWRYITWVLFKAAPTNEDVKKIGDAVRKLSGMTEAEVRSAETFPGSD